jgi:hypothetical protein
MTPEEAQLINGLHDRLDQIPPQSLDSEAERLILSRVASNPHAPYLLTQSVLVLQQAVTGAQTRIDDLEKQLAESKSQKQQGGGSFLSGVANLFGSPQPAAPVRQVAPPSTVAPPPIPQQTSSAGGSFLQNALGTAAGVAGGALLFQGIENMMGHNAGAFSGMGTPSGGFLGQNQPTEVINNYYGSPSDATDPSESGSDFAGSDPLVADNDNNSTDFDQDQDMDFSGGDDSSFS